MRKIALDTETTGLSVEDGDRLVEIGCVEIISGDVDPVWRQWYVNPQRLVPEQAVAIHGLNDAFLADHPPFEQIADAFLAFIGDAELIIHNAAFDLSFLNMELAACGKPKIDFKRVTDTLKVARQKYHQASLDALCRRFSISLEAREKHGALTDAKLLAQVYQHLFGGTQMDLTLKSKVSASLSSSYRNREVRPRQANEMEKKQHKKLLETLNNAMWLKQAKQKT